VQAKLSDTDPRRIAVWRGLMVASTFVAWGISLICFHLYSVHLAAPSAYINNVTTDVLGRFPIATENIADSFHLAF